jgi:hypothetical protein
MHAPSRGAGLLALALLTALPAGAAGPAGAPRSPALTLRLSVPEAAGPAGAHALLPLGSLSASGVHQAAIVRRERVAVRLDGAASHARLSVALAAETPGTVVRVNGQRVTTIPRLIAPVHRVGVTVVHVVEIAIDPAVPAGAFLSNLQWTAETD